MIETGLIKKKKIKKFNRQERIKSKRVRRNG